MFVYANNDGMVLNEATGGTVLMRPGDVWFADDPFVQSRPQLFSETPTRVHSTTGRQAPPATPIGTGDPVAAYVAAVTEAPRGRGRRASA